MKAGFPLDPERYAYIDTETIGLYGKVRLLQVYQTHWDDALIIDSYDEDIEPYLDKLANTTCVFHNGFYDMFCLGRQFPNWEDTYLLSKFAFPHLEDFSLSGVLEEVLGYCPYTDKKAMQKSEWGGLLFPEQLDYAKTDVLYLYKVLEKCLDWVNHPAYKLDRVSVELMIKISRVGLPVNRDKLAEVKDNLTQELMEILCQLPEGFNVKSPKQVREYLGVDNSDDEALSIYASQGLEAAQVIRDARTNRTLLSFIDKFDSDRLYGHFNITTKSGRSSCSDQNLQQLPSKLKSVFESKNFFVYADFSNLELRTFTAMVGERVMYDKFMHNEDLHSFTAMQLFNTDTVTKEKRQIAKVFNFSSLYGAGVAKRLSILLRLTGINISLQEGQVLARRWLDTFPQVREWQSRNQICHDDGVIGYTAMGRPYMSKLFTDFGNLQIQGTGAEVSKLALVYLNDRVDINKLCVFIHDSYTFECETLDEARVYAKALVECMKLAWETLRPKFHPDVRDLQMPVEAVIAANWKDCQDGTNIIEKIGD